MVKHLDGNFSMYTRFGGKSLGLNHTRRRAVERLTAVQPGGDVAVYTVLYGAAWYSADMTTLRITQFITLSFSAAVVAVVAVAMAIRVTVALRPVHLLRVFLLRVLESNFPGDFL